MSQGKNAVKSKTIWGLVALLASQYVPADLWQQPWVEHVFQVLAGALVVYGRMVAKEPITILPKIGG